MVLAFGSLAGGAWAVLLATAAAAAGALLLLPFWFSVPAGGMTKPKRDLAAPRVGRELKGWRSSSVVLVVLRILEWESPSPNPAAVSRVLLVLVEAFLFIRVLYGSWWGLVHAAAVMCRCSACPRLCVGVCLCVGGDGCVSNTAKVVVPLD